MMAFGRKEECVCKLLLLYFLYIVFLWLKTDAESDLKAGTERSFETKVSTILKQYDGSYACTGDS